MEIQQPHFKMGQTVEVEVSMSSRTTNKITAVVDLSGTVTSVCYDPRTQDLAYHYGVTVNDGVISVPEYTLKKLN